MITYIGRGGQPRRPIDAANLMGVPLRRRATIVPFPVPATCTACQGTGEVPRWDPEGGIFGDFFGVEPCNCPAAAALIAAGEAAVLAAVGSEPSELDDEWPGF